MCAGSSNVHADYLMIHAYGMNVEHATNYIICIHRVVPHVNNQDSLFRIAYESELPLTRTALPPSRSIFHVSTVHN